MDKAYFESILQQRILILDGAMGTTIQQYGLGEKEFKGERFAKVEKQLKGNNDVLNITQPQIIAEIHRRYLEAGADIITTNTFCSQVISQAEYGLEAESSEMALKGARIAREMADRYYSPEKPRWVAGSVGPTNKTCSLSPDVNNPAARDICYDDLYTAYRKQIDAMVEGGIDLLLIETIFDTLNAKAAVAAAVAVMEVKQVQLPIVLSITVSDGNGRMLGGQTIEAFLATISTLPIFAVGMNCSLGAKQMKPLLRILSEKASCYVVAYPNAGMPNCMGEYDETAEEMSAHVAGFIEERLVNVLGGCCGTTDEFIRSFATLTEGQQPRTVPAKDKCMQLAGLEPLYVNATTGFVNVGERCNVAGSRKFLRLINEKKYEEALAIARKQVKDGALVIDINMDDALLDAEREMTTFLNLIASEPDIAAVPVMIDSSDWKVIASALKCVQGKCIVNSISLKVGEEAFLEHAALIKRHGAAAVVMCFDEQGQATTYERRIEIAERAYRLLTQKVGMAPQDIIFDPNILAVATGMEEHASYALDFIRATEWIKRHLPGAHVSGGVSNLSFSFRGNNYIREAMHAVFLYHAMQKGMDFGIVNPNAKVAYSDIPAPQLSVIEDVILNKRHDAGDLLLQLADEIKAEEERRKVALTAGGDAVKQTPVAERPESIEERIVQSLVKGVGDYMQSDLQEALHTYNRAVDIIEGPLMSGMNQVGELFGNGKMFLPQVVKSARTMKQAVGILQPYIEQENSGMPTKAGTVLVATVKGDVHDIGKNIVSVVLACNNYHVIDLGVMVPAEQIVEQVLEHRADIVGLSGLITPSLEEMIHVIEALNRAQITVPVMIGGATTNELYVALRLAPLYHGEVVWVKDASQNPIVASHLLDANNQSYIASLHQRYEKLRADYQSRQVHLRSLEEARENKLNLF